MSTTPFELRFGIYKSAEDRLLKKYYSDLTVWETGMERGDIGRQPTFPTHDEILDEAEKIYAFVQTKD